jgi:two-component system response regulator YesN
MIRILVADDERPVVEGISHIVRRDLSGEFAVVGTACSGREAIEKAAALSPDLILMDVRMPGISGLEAIRELRRRGSPSAFVLITAYERFDIAREAVELGVLDYLLKPVSKDRLALSLRSAASFIARKGEIESREIRHREVEEGMRAFVEAAFLQGIMLGERWGPAIERYGSALGIAEPLASLVAAAFFPSPGALDPAAEARAAFDAFRGTIRYKTRALVGPLVGACCALLLPLRDESEAAGSEADLRLAVEASHSGDLSRGRLRLGFGKAMPLVEAATSWQEALADLLRGALPSGRGRAAGAAPIEAEDRSFEDGEYFLESLLAPSPERASLAFERLVAPLRGLPSIVSSDAYRLISLFGEAIRSLRRRGLLSADEAAAAMDLEDLRRAANGQGFELALRARFSALSAAAERNPRRFTPLRAAVDSIKGNFAKPITLESVADELGISPSRLSRLFIEETGKGFSDFLIDYRIEKAKEMLGRPDATIKQVSAACGYPDPNYFSRLFKKETGLTPSSFSSGATEASDEIT